MNVRTMIALAIAMTAISATPTIALSRQDDVKAQAHRDASIKRMQERVAEIETEMVDAETAHAQALGEEAFNLYGQIDQTYLQMKNVYQQQVIELNLRMQRKWEQVESAEMSDRESINEAFSKLEADWERTFERLTLAHECHLEQLNHLLAGLNGELSDAAGRATAELEASSFEAISRWEEGHDIFLALNKTYVQIVGDRLGWLEKESAEHPEDESLLERFENTRERYSTVQGRFQSRLLSHLTHLEKELQIRRAHLEATSVWQTRREIMKIVDGLYIRTHATFEHLQVSYVDTTANFVRSMSGLPGSSGRYSELNELVAGMNSSLGESYLKRVEFISSQICDLENRIETDASPEEKANWTATMTDLRLLSRSLRAKAVELAEPPARTVRR